MDLQKILKEAHEAGMKAVSELNVVPMVVGEAKSLFGNEIDTSKPTYFVADGVCGFAWVDVFERKNSAIAKQLKASGLFKDRYEGKGIYMWVSDFNQSMQKKEAYAYAFAKVLQAHGIKAYSGSRMD